jgi:alkanesulfonate monooxygenase SsuD/methylene tetrahydromethanopterin reductase-like flavin-dependent oxidoreductase (luciferase family)
VTDYGHELSFGTFLTPGTHAPERVVGLAQLSEELSLDLVTFQDHPYQPALLDTWTLLSYVAAATVQITLAPNVLNLPLRPPAVVARAAASLDRLSGGRLELGLGAGAFWDGIVGMGGERLSPGESVVALDEAIQIIRQLWDPTVRGGVRVAGTHHRVSGAKRGPAPAHDIQIWVGSYKPRMLRLTGRVADGWLPSSAYLPPDELAAANTIIDEAAVAVGRDPRDIRRLYNVSGSFASRSAGFLQGPPGQWVEELAALSVQHGIATFILGSDDPDVISTFAQQVVPAVREAVAAQRTNPSPDSPLRRVDSHGAAPDLTSADPDRSPVEAGTPLPSKAPAATSPFPVAATPDDGTRLAEPLWDEAARPSAPPAPATDYDHRDLASAQQLVDIHDHLRSELSSLRDLISQVLDGSTDPAAARSSINEMTMRQNNWTVGAYCAAYCRIVTTHHSIEDQALFPRLSRTDPRLAPVVDRLHAEHEVIHEVLEAVDRALVSFVGPGHDGERLQRAVDQLTDTLLSHLSYEERELLEPIARFGILV